MGRLSRRLSTAWLAAMLLAGALPGAVLGFTGFGETSADATYGEAMRFGAELRGGTPDRLELLLRFSGDDAVFVAPVAATGDGAEYVWDTADRHVTPNTRIEHWWRATHEGRVTESARGTLLYDDDRAGLDWRSQRYGEATVHWYGDSEAVARRFGELAANGTARAEALLGHEMSGPVDIFVYASSDHFFGALGPGAREWTGAATYPALRTIFMSLASGGSAYLETTLVHEVTHVVFNDATDNPFHEPAKWLNEGLATWLEDESADAERSEVEFEAGGGGLFAFEAIAEQFPIGERGARLAYAQGATMVDMIVAEQGRGAIARIAEAYRDGASDSEALKAGTGLPSDVLFAAFYDEFGVDPPQPVEPEPIPPSDVRKPGGQGPTGTDDPPASPGSAPDAAAGGGGVPWLAVTGVTVLLLVAALAAWAVSRRRATVDSP
ncbi:MAG TPA: peptidase MA family metallohydrolase [Candidatus Limnocylindria bacterium]